MKETTPNIISNPESDNKIEALMTKIKENSNELEKARQDIAEIKETISNLETAPVESKANGTLKPKYKKVLKIIDIIAFIIIIFVIIDGVFNGFGMLYALSKLLSNLF